MSTRRIQSIRSRRSPLQLVRPAFVLFLLALLPMAVVERVTERGRASVAAPEASASGEGERSDRGAAREGEAVRG